MERKLPLAVALQRGQLNQQKIGRTGTSCGDEDEGCNPRAPGSDGWRRRLRHRACNTCDGRPAADADGFVPDRAFEKHLAEQLLDAKPGDVISVPAGEWKLSRAALATAWASPSAVPGATGRYCPSPAWLRVRLACRSPVTASALADLTVQDTKGDGVQINGTKGVTIRGVRVLWTSPDNTTHGAYGLYPVGCTDVLEDSEVSGSSDAGIYVGQSDNIIVRRNHAMQNVAGIEIENSTHADVYENVATGNTGGILVFNMPNLPKPGGFTRIRGNISQANKTRQFRRQGHRRQHRSRRDRHDRPRQRRASRSSTTSIKDDDTVGIAIASDYSTNYKIEASSPGAHDPFPERVLIANNTISGIGAAPDNALFRPRNSFSAPGRA
jgi:parallel beta-helix repeat protein